MVHWDASPKNLAIQVGGYSLKEQIKTSDLKQEQHVISENKLNSFNKLHFFCIFNLQILFLYIYIEYYLSTLLVTIIPEVLRYTSFGSIIDLKISSLLHITLYSTPKISSWLYYIDPIQFISRIRYWLEKSIYCYVSLGII